MERMVKAPNIALVALVFLPACAWWTGEKSGDRSVRSGDEISICGQLYHTGTPVVLWSDPGGFDAYRSVPRFPDEMEEDTDDTMLKPAPRFSGRSAGVPEELLERVQNEGWTLDDLRSVVDQFVIHYDVCGTSRRCFRVLQDQRQLSVHFLLDVDGTIYQTLDVKEKAWHATKSNSRSVGIEIAQIGAYDRADHPVLEEWYESVGDEIHLTIPEEQARKAGFAGRTFVTDSNEMHEGGIHDQDLYQYDFTPQQYEALARLLATIHRVLPRIELEIPRGRNGDVFPGVLDDRAWAEFSGVLGHYHIQSNKVDPGPALDWEHILERSRCFAGDAGHQ